MATARWARLLRLVLCIAASTVVATATPVLSALSVDFSTTSTALLTTLTVTGNFAGSFGVSTTGGMVGPAVSCYVPPSNAAGAVCTDINANYGVTKVTSVSTIVSATASASSWTLTVSTPLTRLGITPGTTVTMMFAFQNWVSSQQLPAQHSFSSRTLQSIAIPAASTTAASATTTAAPTITTTTALSPTSTTATPTTTTAVPTTTVPPTTTTTAVPATASNMSAQVTLFGSTFTADIAFDATSVYMTMIVVGSGYSGTVGFAPTGMNGGMVTCFVRGDGVPTCADLDGVSYYVQRSATQSTRVVQATANATVATYDLVVPRSRFPSISAECRVVCAHTAFDVTSGLPLPHSLGDFTNHAQLAVNFISGTTSLTVLGYDNRGTAYMIVGISGGAVLLLFAAVARLGATLSPRMRIPAALLALGVVVGLAAIVIAYAERDFAAAGRTVPTYRAFGECNAFLLSIVVVPTAKWVGIGRLLGSSFERLWFLHRLVALLLIVSMTTHMGGMFASFAQPSTLFQKPSNVYGFVAWLCLMAVVLPAIFLRESHYRVFRYTHLLVIPLYVLGSLHYPRLWLMLIPGVALWAVDLLLRLYQAASNDAHVIECVYHPASRVVKLTLSVAWNAPPPPSSFVFVSMPPISRVLHPFSVATCEPADDKDRCTATLLIRVQGERSWTSNLSKLCSLPPGTIRALPVSVWGPHGALQIDLARTVSLALLAGGIGITPMLSILQYLTSWPEAAPLLEEVTLIWSFREAALLEIAKDVLQQALNKSRVRSVEIKLYCTAPSREMAVAPPTLSRPRQEFGVELDDHFEPPAPQPQQRRVSAADPCLVPARGRPPLERLLQQDQRATPKSCCICGPAPFVDECTAVASRLGHRIHVEEFSI